MAVPYRHLLSQGRVLSALGRTVSLAVLASVRPSKSPDEGAVSASLPGPYIREAVSPLPPDLIRDYLENVGGQQSSYPGVVPPHLFPQWAFPIATRTLEDTGYPLLRVVNGGCRVRVNDTIPAGTPLDVRGRLESIEDNGRRAVLEQYVETGNGTRPDALVANFYAIVPSPRSTANGDTSSEPRAEPRAERKETPRVPVGARAIDTWNLRADAGLEFALLTGDVNPIHWVSAYARMSGFKDVILHGFGSMARTWESLVRGVLAGDAAKLRELDVRFTRPLVLPAQVHVYIADNRVFVGDAPGGPAYLTGTYFLGD